MTTEADNDNDPEVTGPQTDTFILTCCMGVMVLFVLGVAAAAGHYLHRVPPVASPAAAMASAK